MDKTMIFSIVNDKDEAFRKNLNLVYDALKDIPEPIKPDDTESFIEAQINVLSWHLIQQDVTLQ